EAAQGNRDLNGDGDATDLVLHVFERTTRSVTNTHLDASLPTFAGDLLVFGVNERYQGAIDQNGDGDSADTVLFLLDVATGALTNTYLALGSTDLAFLGTTLLCGVSEQGQGNTDLNGDSDALDTVLYEVDTSTMVATNLMQCFERSHRVGTYLLLEVAEPA